MKAREERPEATDKRPRGFSTMRACSKLSNPSAPASNPTNFGGMRSNGKVLSQKRRRANIPIIVAIFEVRRRSNDFVPTADEAVITERFDATSATKNSDAVGKTIELRHPKRQSRPD
jgi:hypothetical protein